MLDLAILAEGGFWDFGWLQWTCIVLLVGVLGFYWMWRKKQM